MPASSRRSPPSPTIRGDLEADLTAFAFRLNSNCVCSRDGKFLRRLLQNEGERYPELFAGWREDGPGKTWAALAARFARLAHAGYLDIDDPDLAARQFLALVNADLHVTSMLGETPDEAQLQRSAANAVRTFLRAYRRRPEPLTPPVAREIVRRAPDDRLPCPISGLRRRRRFIKRSGTIQRCGSGAWLTTTYATTFSPRTRFAG